MVTCRFLQKKPFAIILLVITCFSPGFSQEKERIRVQDENGTIILEGEIEIYGDKIDTVWVRRFNSNGIKIEEKRFKNGDLHGAWKRWYGNGSKKFIIKYKKGVVHGTSENYDSTGLTIIQGRYKNGELHGKQKEWFSNGKLLKVAVYRLGLMNGDYNEWWEDGEEKIKGQYSANIKEGQWTYYDPGRRSRYEFHRSGELFSSYDFEYYENGQLKEEPSFDAGTIDGRWIEYFQGGEKSSQREYKKGKPDGNWIAWNEETNRKIQEMEYKDSLLVNKYLEWWPSGEKKVEGQYTANKKEGWWTYHDPGRKLLLEDEYRGWWGDDEKYIPARRSRYEFYRSGELFSSYDFEYYLNGQIKEEPSFDAGIVDGRWMQYFEGGENASQREYINGRPDGVWLTWHDSTFVKVQEMVYKDSLLEDNYFEWWMDEKQKITGFYVQDKRDSLWTYWDKFEHERFEEYDLGELISSWGWEYYENGQVKEEIVYREGVKHGEWHAYYEDGSYSGYRGFNNGVKDGTWIDWYTNGQKSFKRKYELGQPVDKWQYWYFSGELMSAVEYENNEIILQQCYQSTLIHSNPDEKVRDCSAVIKPEDLNQGVFRIYSPSKVLIKESYITENKLLAQFEYHHNSEPSAIKLFKDGVVILFKNWNPKGIEIIDDPEPSGLFSSWDYYPNGDIKYKVTYMGVEKKEKHGIEWFFYKDRIWKQINIYYQGILQLSRNWERGASISSDSIYKNGNKVFPLKLDVQNKPTKEDKKKAAAYFRQALKKAKKKDYSGTLKDLKKSYKLNPSKKVKTLIDKLNSLLNKEIKPAISKKPTKEDKKKAAAYYKRGIIKAKKKDYSGALKDLKKSYKLSPSRKVETLIDKLNSLLKKRKKAAKSKKGKN